MAKVGSQASLFDCNPQEGEDHSHHRLVEIPGLEKLLERLQAFAIRRSNNAHVARLKSVSSRSQGLSLHPKP